MLEQEYTSEKSYKLIDLTITSTNGQFTNIYGLLAELSIFEDIYNSTISGHVTISDAIDLIASMPLSGFEFITIKLGKPGSEASSYFEKVFRIYKIQSREISLASNSSHAYTLYFCSEENIVSESNKISKSYKAKESSYIVDDILKKYLKVSSKKYNPSNVENAFGVYDVIIPYLSPLTAITWLSGRTLSSSSRPDFLFYENTQGFNYKSLGTLFQQNSKGLYSYDLKNIDFPTDKPIDEIKDVIKYDFVSIFDILSSVSLGTYSSTLRTVDLLRLKFENGGFNYKKYFDEGKHIEKNGGSFQNEYTDRFGKKIYENFSSHIKMYPTTRDHDKVSDIVSSQPGIRPNLVEKWLLQRVSQIRQLNYFKLRLVIPGDVYLTVGDIIEFNVPIVARKNPGEPNYNRLYSGRYLITAIRHKIDLQSYEMIIEATRDCISESYVNASSGEPTLDGLSKQ